MSTGKRMDVVCIVAIVLALLVTVLFMNGKNFGLVGVPSEENDDSYFTANDKNGAWDTAKATKIVLSGDTAKVTGDSAYFLDGTVYVTSAGRFVVSGTLDDGQIRIDAGSSDKVWMQLDNAAIHCESDAAIRVEQAEKVFLTLKENSENTVSAGAGYLDEAVENGVDGAIFSRDDLTINGSGSLTVTADYQHGIVCNDDLVFAGGTVNVTAKADGLHANDSARFADTALSISAGDDGVTVSNDENTAYIYVQSGTIRIDECYEGMEAINITVAGGDVSVYPSDDGLNANGSAENAFIRVTGGSVSVLNGNGRDADGLDSNGSIFIEGGTVFVSLNGDGSNCALDCGTESGGKCTVTGGTVIACGGASMAEGFDGDSSTQCSLLHTLSSTAAAGSDMQLSDSDGNTILSKQIPNSYTCIVLSSPDLKQGETVTLTCGGTSEQIELSDMATSNGTGGMMGGGMRGGMGGMRGGFGEQTSGEDASQAFGFGERPTGADGSELSRENGFGRMGGNRQRSDSDFSMPDGERPSMPEGDFSMPDGERASMPEGDFSMPDGERPSMPEGGFSMPDGEGMSRPDDMGGLRQGMRGEESTTEAAAEDGPTEVSAQTWMWIAVCAVVLLAGILIAILFKSRSVQA